MAVISCKLIGNRSGEHNSQFQKSYEVSYRLLTNDPLDGPQVVVNHPELPALYSEYAFGNDADGNCLLISKVPREESDGSFRTWVVTCSYSNAPPADLDSNPLTEAPRASMSFEQFSTIARVDVDGQFICNSVNQPFVPPPEIDQSRPVLIVRRNESFIDLPKAADFSDAVNQSAWKGMPPRTVKCRSIGYSEQQTRNGITYREATYEFHLNDLTWDLRPLNQALKYKGSDDRYHDLPPGSEPVTLYTGEDGSSKDRRVPRGVPVTMDAVYLRKRVFKERNFNLLALNF